jgi:hypothetical protein
MPLVLLFVAAIVLFASNHGVAQSTAAPPTPAAAHERLAFLIGSWRVVETTTAGPMTIPGNTTIRTTTCEWFDGKFQVVCKSDSTMSGGTPLRGLEVFAYDTREHGYTQYYISSSGVGMLTKGNVSGKTWNWGPTANEVRGNTLMATETITEVSPDSWTSRVMVSMDGRPAQLVSEGTATRIPEAGDDKGSRSFAILRNKFTVTYDSTKWKAGKTEDSMTQFSHVSGEAWLRVDAQRFEIAPDHFREVILMSAKEIDPGLSIASETPHEVAGLEAEIIRYEGTVRGIKFTVLNQIGSSTEGTIQIAAFAPTNLLPEYEHDILEFFAGLRRNTDGK